MALGELGAYLAIGVAVGFFAGLLGIGGGIIIVSALALMFAAHGFPEQYVMHLAVGTSLAAIVSGSWSSLRTHHRHKAVDWDVVRRMTPGLLAGVLGGAIVARFLSTAFLKYFFLTFMLLIISQMVVNLRPKATRGLPGTAGLTVVATFIGVCSSLFGGGAAAIGVPFLAWCNVTTHRAIGTVAAMGFPLSNRRDDRIRRRGVGRRGLAALEPGLRLPAGLRRHLDHERARGAVRCAPRAPAEGRDAAARLRAFSHPHGREGRDFRLGQAMAASPRSSS